MGFGSKYRNEIGLLAAILGVIGFTLLNDRAYLELPLPNLINILHQTALLGIFALGAAIVIIAGGIDLSSGSVIVFSGSICALVMNACAPSGADGTPLLDNIGWEVVVLAISATLIVGFMIGTLHTWLINVIRVPPFVATLASLVGLRSLAKVLNPALTGLFGKSFTTIPVESVRFDYFSEWWVAISMHSEATKRPPV